MNDATDKKRFEKVARLFAGHLKNYGLAPAKLVTHELDDNEGFWTFAGYWTDERGKKSAIRPSITIFLDTAIDEVQRRFWFGFDASRPEATTTLAREAGYGVETAVLKDNYDVKEYRRKVLSQNGLALEMIRPGEHYLGKYEIGFDVDSDEQLAAAAAHFILHTIETADPAFAERRDVETIKRLGIGLSEREALILARRGQGKFRAALYADWKGCAVSGCATNEVLRASHIKPWWSSTDTERRDPHNGLLLTASLDALFDRGLISFADDGRIQISPRLGQEDWKSLGVTSEARLRKQKLSPKLIGYLKYHRANVFKAKP